MNTDMLEVLFSKIQQALHIEEVGMGRQLADISLNGNFVIHTWT